MLRKRPVLAYEVLPEDQSQDWPSTESNCAYESTSVTRLESCKIRCKPLMSRHSMTPLRNVVNEGAELICCNRKRREMVRYFRF